MTGTVVNHPIALRRLTVGQVRDLGPRMRRLTLVGDELAAFDRDGWSLPPLRSDGPDDHVKVFFAPPGASQPVLPEQRDGHLDWPADHSVVHRDYTVRRFDPDAGELDLDFVLHDDGVATAWAHAVQVGDPVVIAGPRSSHLPPPASTTVLVGDETALPAIARWIEQALPGTSIFALVEVADRDDHQTIDHLVGVDAQVVFVDRDSDDDVVERLRDVGRLDTDAFAFVAGEHGLVQRVRRALHDHHGLPDDRCRAVGYWRQGISEADEHDRGHEIRELADLLTPHAVRVAATLRLADHIDRGSTTVASLADAAGVDPTSLAALVAHLSTKDLFTVREDATITLGPLGSTLLDGHPSGARRKLDLDSAQAHMDLGWAGLRHTATTGRPGFTEVFGLPFWDHLQSDASLVSSFDGLMAEWAYVWVPGVRDTYDWSSHRHIVDVGGGIGLLLAELLTVAPSARGTLVELPATVATAEWWFTERGLVDRAAAIAGSFFEPLPGGDAIVLAQVIHDWPDDEAIAILANARAALDPGGRVLLVERVVKSTGAALDPTHAAMTLLMRNLFAATERTEAQFTQLAERAGLVHRATHDAGGAVHVLELAAG